jgi:hypothetical protein
MLIETLETRQLLSASLAPNPGNPQAANSGNAIAVGSSQIIHNGPVVSTTQAQTGQRSDLVQAALAASGRGSEA